MIRYDGKRGTVWRIKYLDAGGRQVKETLGRDDDGWTRKRAQAELRARLTDVHREGRRKLDAVAFGAFADEWLTSYAETKGLKCSTREGYRSIVERHLSPAFANVRLEHLDSAKVEQYVAAKRRAGLSPRTVNRHLNLMHKLLDTAERRQLVRVNAVRLVERPREPRRRWTILSPAEVVRVERAFAELVDQAETDAEREWREQARVVFVAIMGTGMRRGELLGLRWRNVRLADPDGASVRVAETWVRNQNDTPKSEKGERTIALGSRVAEELFEHRRRSHFDGDDDRVFCHPQMGGPLDHKRYAATLRLALRRAKIEKPMRPFHDGRHTSITNAAAAGTSPAALMARAGHSDFATTQLYIDLSGEAFRDEAELLERRLWGGSGTKNRYQDDGLSSESATETAELQG